LERKGDLFILSMEKRRQEEVIAIVNKKARGEPSTSEKKKREFRKRGKRKIDLRYKEKGKRSQKGFFGQ